ncbi:hypothetical protein AURANDRAFT_39515 [Aureococcus anophagefferens]|uniref:Protein kinase domain-containing protein n=1 Tax=Aureococcus anophagefferens TaxID=44056 RepID=F0YR66_AURAN|nr:hypothetical protein AURANDRAFT_39515 [Aureococcus anophagefferens]EGB02391.1 hypothetical protein AURANDRAFT_39515 [Aureococcus anophagefferens]|eukprot:XP_009042908.1 hypothetical protein AURANDRAFT_39515 [Aureococcus anophagefferens]
MQPNRKKWEWQILQEWQSPTTISQRPHSWEWEIKLPGRDGDVSPERFLEGEARYEILERLGKGTFGEVCAARDLKLHMDVAIKRISDAFAGYTCAKRTLREVRILRLLDAHENLIKMRRHSPTDVYVVFELMDTDLSRVIESSQHLGDEHIKFFMYQLLSAVHFLHTAGIAHRDIKPRNMLVNADCTLKICDFGLARLCTPDLVVDGGMTDYVATRWYRAPEHSQRNAIDPRAFAFDDDDDDGGGDNAAREYEDARLSKEIIQEIEYYQADPVMDSLSVFFCCALSPTRTGEAC